MRSRDTVIGLGQTSVLILNTLRSSKCWLLFRCSASQCAIQLWPLFRSNYSAILGRSSFFIPTTMPTPCCSKAAWQQRRSRLQQPLSCLLLVTRCLERSPHCSHCFSSYSSQTLSHMGL